MKSSAAQVFILYLSLISTSTLVTGRPNFFPSASLNPSSGPWHSLHKLVGSHKGDHAAGLAKLKHCFHQFGYIPFRSNFTDNFDETLEFALKLYQNNFNLNVTGKLDNTTAHMIARPRCGHVDNINGHTVSHYSFVEDCAKWPDSKRHLTYSFLLANQLDANSKAIFARTFQKWSTVTPLTFTKTDSYQDADIKIGFFVGEHDDEEAFDGPLGILAHAFGPTIGLFHLDADEDWIIDGDVGKSTSSIAIDLESVCVHEIGHLLGLGHSSVEEAIMYPYIQPGTRKTRLADDDIEGIQVLYGSNPNYVHNTNDGGAHIVNWQWSRATVTATIAIVGLLL